MSSKLITRSFFEPLKVLKCNLNASVTGDGKFVLVQVSAKSNEDEMKFPTVWLRDNCQCSDCFHSGTLSRKINWNNLKMNTIITKINTNKTEKLVTVSWQDGHQSTYELNWLADRDFTTSSRDRYLQTIYKPVANLWGKSDFPKIAKTFEFDAVKNDDKGNTL